MSTHPMMQLFSYGHLRADLQEVSKLFGDLAAAMDALLPDNTQKDRFFDKLVEAKDCAVRARFYKGVTPT